MKSALKVSEHVEDRRSSRKGLSRTRVRVCLRAWPAGDVSYLRRTMAFLDMNRDLVRMRRSIGAPIVAWSPQGLAHPARVFCSGTELVGEWSDPWSPSSHPHSHVLTCNPSNLRKSLCS